MVNDRLKQDLAHAALDEVKDVSVLGIGTGTTVNFFIDALSALRGQLEGCVASSEASAARLKALGIPLLELSSVSSVPIYIDGADEIVSAGYCIKGAGGALTREKIIASNSKQFICLVDESKWVGHLGQYRPVPVEVLPMARSSVARQFVAWGAQPVYREQYRTDNGHIILDVYHLDLSDPLAMEHRMKLIPGVIESGLFAQRYPDVVLTAGVASGVLRLGIK